MFQKSFSEEDKAYLFGFNKKYNSKIYWSDDKSKCHIIIFSDEAKVKKSNAVN